jgi:hypothetical protein
MMLLALALQETLKGLIADKEVSSAKQNKRRHREKEENEGLS